MIKKVFSFLLSAVLIVSSLSAVIYAFAEEPVQLGTTSTFYTYNELTKTLTISGSGAMPNYTNQNKTPWFDYRANIEHIQVKEGVTEIGKYSFYSFVSCTDVSLPSSLTKLNKYAFSYAGISEIKLPESLTFIDNYAFSNSALQSLSIPSAVTEIGMYAFENCSYLTDIAFQEDSLCILRSYAFCNCKNLTSITIPSKVTMEGYSFGYDRSIPPKMLGENFTIYGFTGSSAHTYAVANSGIHFVDIEAAVIPLYEGSSVKAEIINDGGSRYFSFTPEVSAEYKFFSLGNTDVEGELFNANNESIAKSDDISEANRNFSFHYYCNAGETYNLTVSGYYVSGFFAVSVMPVNISEISAAFNPAVSFTEYVDSKTVNGVQIYDYESSLSALGVTFIYDTGFEVTVPASDGRYEDIDINVTDSQKESPWTVGENYIAVEYGDLKCSALVTVKEHTHNYQSEIVLPTLSEQGYTVYTCTYCGDTYKDEYVDRIGKKITGKVVIMEKQNGEHSNDIGICDAEIYIDGNYVCKTDENGAYSFFAESGEHTLTVKPLYGSHKEISVTVQNDMHLESVAVMGFDFNHDSVINARDFAEFLKIANSDNAYTADYNGDGVTDKNDFKLAENFYTE